MNEPKRLPDRLRALFRRQPAAEIEPAEELPTVSWAMWFTTEAARRGRLSLSRAGMETYASMVVGAREDGEGDLVVLIDPPLPSPERETPDEIVALDARLLHMDEGIEIATTFRAVLGEELRHEGYEAVELVDISDLDVEYREYLARVTEAHGVELNLVWEGEMITVYPSHIAAGRMLFNADIEGDIGPDGIEIPKASICLEPGGKDYALSLRLLRRPEESFEVEITRIDAPVKRKLVTLIEEIWRTDAGLSRYAREPKKIVGYRTREHDTLAEAFQRHIVFLGEDPGWKDFLAGFGIVKQLGSLSPHDLVEVVLGGRCDLLVGEYAFCGREAVSIEHTLQAYARTRKIPRFWILPENPGDTTPDMLAEGAFDQFTSEQLKQPGLTDLFNWAIAGTELGSGERTALLVSAEPRMRYRLGLALANAGAHFLWRENWRGLLPELGRIQPNAVILDARTVKYDINAILDPLLEVAAELKFETMLLVDTVQGETLLRWREMGLQHIILLDPSLRETAQHLVAKLDWEV